MSFENLLSLPGVANLGLLAVASGVMSLVLAYRETTYLKPLVTEIRNVTAEFEKMTADGELDQQEVKQVITYVTDLFNRVKNRI